MVQTPSPLSPVVSGSGVGFLVGAAGPFGERAFDRAQVVQVERLHAAHRRRPVNTNFPGDEVAGRYVQRGPHILRNGGLTFGGNFGDGKHGVLR